MAFGKKKYPGLVCREQNGAARKQCMDSAHLLSSLFLYLAGFTRDIPESKPPHPKSADRTSILPQIFFWMQYFSVLST